MEHKISISFKVWQAAIHALQEYVFEHGDSKSKIVIAAAEALEALECSDCIVCEEIVSKKED